VVRLLKNTCSLLFIIFTAIIIVSCVRTMPDGPPDHPVNLQKIPNAKPRPLPRSKYGNPASYVIHGKRYYVLKTEKGYHKRGIASWYGTKFQGALTSSREPYNMLAMTAASPVLPIPSFVRVTNLRNPRSVIVKVNDRGPFVGNRILDLSYVAAAKLGYASQGTAPVEVQVISDDRPHPFNHSATFVKTKFKHPLKHSPDKHWFVQLGAFRQFHKAKDLTNRLKGIVTKPVSIYMVKKNNALVYRVSIGPLVSFTESIRLQRQLKKLGFLDITTITGTGYTHASHSNKNLDRGLG
jgi:rare lipoprotein A